MVTKADRKSNPKRFWSLLKGLAGKRSGQAPPNQPISFENNIVSQPKQIAKHSCRQYANAKPFKPTKESRALFRDIKINNPLDQNYSPFSPPEVAVAIRRTKNLTDAGPNKITALHLKHLGPTGLRFLTRLFTLSVREACIPVIWRSANIVTISKPGKSLDQGTSYRPISLLCPEIKVLERLLLPDMIASLQSNNSQQVSTINGYRLVSAYHHHHARFQSAQTSIEDRLIVCGHQQSF